MSDLMLNQKTKRQKPRLVGRIFYNAATNKIMRVVTRKYPRVYYVEDIAAKTDQMRFYIMSTDEITALPILEPEVIIEQQREKNARK